MIFFRYKLCVCVTWALGLTFSPLSDAEDIYYGVNISSLDYTETTSQQINLPVFSVPAISGKLGKKWDDNFSGELRAGFGLSEDELVMAVNGSIVPVKLALNSFYGAYIRVGEQINSTFYPYAIAGYTRGKMSASVLGFKNSHTETDTSFGIGFDLYLSKSLKVNFEYMNYLDKNSASIDGLSVGLTSSF